MAKTEAEFPPIIVERKLMPMRSILLHNPFMISGVNLGNRLEIGGHKVPDMKLYYDAQNDRYIVTAKGCGKFIHSTNVADSEPIDLADLGVPIEKHPAATPRVRTAGAAMVANVSRTAQVGDPTRGNIKPRYQGE